MSAETQPSSAAAWLDNFFTHYYRRRPVSATFIGVHEHDGELPDYSAAGVGATLTEMRELLDRLELGLVEPPSDTFEAIDLLLARNYLMQQVWELNSDWFQRGNPCVYTGEAIFGVISLFLRDYAPVEQRMVAAIQRLEEIPHLLEQGRANVASAPRGWVERAIDECIGADTFLTTGVAELRRMHAACGPAFQGAADAARQAFTEHRVSLETEGRAGAHARYGCGADAFDFLMHVGHGLDMTALDVAAYARQRLDMARAALDARRHTAHDGASWLDIARQAAAKHPTADAYLPAFQRVWDAARTFAIERELVSWPDFPLVFEPIPTWARAAAPHLYFLHYRSPAPFDADLVQRYLVPPLDDAMSDAERERVLRAVNDSQIVLNHVVHHAGLGHHVQNANAFRSRSRVGRMAAVDCALRVAMFGAGTLCEGWACYATDLMREAGFLNPLHQTVALAAQQRMAARAIVDAELHAGLMSLDQAVAFYQDVASMPAAAARGEALKNSMFPGAAMMYLLGTDMIHDVRDEMRARWGDTFTLRRFHDEFLSYGSIPVSVIAGAMRGEPIESVVKWVAP